MENMNVEVMNEVEVKETAKRMGKLVFMKDAEGNTVQQFNSVKEAGEYLVENGSPTKYNTTCANIRKACAEGTELQGYFWSKYSMKELKVEEKVQASEPQVENQEVQA